MDFGIATVASISALCYLAGEIVKASRLDNKWIPIVCGVSGAALGIMSLYIGAADFPATDHVTAAAIGVASGFAATGINQAIKQITGQ